MDRTGVLVALLVTLGWFAAIIAWAARRARRTQAWWIVDRLTCSDQNLSVHVSATSRVWNPAKPPGIDNGITGPGTATYRREARPEGDLIHLDFTPRHSSSTQHLVGPIPDSAVPGSTSNARARKAIPTVAAMIYLPVLVLGITVGVALFASSGRAVGWVLGVGIGLALLPAVAVTWLRVGRAVRRRHR